MRSAAHRERRDWNRSQRAAAHSSTPMASKGQPEVLHPSTRDMLAKVWLQDAREEHASIAAFARWTLLMLSVGAPPEMIRDSQRASLDEIEHATACFSIARHYGAGDVGPDNLDLTNSLESLSLAEIASLTAEEGCVGETLGVALAMEQLRGCEVPMVRAELERLVRDEKRHAALAWRFVAWAIARGGESVANAVTQAIEHAIDATLEAPLLTYAVIDVDEWHRHGRVTCVEAREIVREAVSRVVRPALALARSPAIMRRASDREGADGRADS
jgi:hypothetical protein